ncbi:hypothetical protein Bca52824_010314 [Brassica carinata]|uniref:Uncharacterized protein n=1 Tax=Brassica carinata TaxID=52824 RepID=A0A8X7WCF8_BRACI|nr:hypothetical protein Bca52824_010314 [Brassica carinata]
MLKKRFANNNDSDSDDGDTTVMETSRLPLSFSIRGKLISSGYTSLSLISSVSSTDLARDVNIKKAEAFEILKMANQITKSSSCNGKSSSLVNGDSWSHSCTNRVILYWNGDERYTYIDKSPSLPSAFASYSVTSIGLRNSYSSSKRVKMMRIKHETFVVLAFQVG